MTNKSREKVREALPGASPDKKTCGFMNRQWVVNSKL